MKKYTFYATTTVFNNLNEGKVYKVSAELNSIEDAYIFGTYICECLNLGDTANSILTSNTDWKHYLNDSKDSMYDEEDYLEHLDYIDTFVDYQILYIVDNTRNPEVVYTNRDWVKW